MHFTAKTFYETVLKLLQDSDKNLERLLDAYLWAQDHLKEIHAIMPTYEQRWLASEMRRIFNVDVTTYVRTARRLGGGTKPEQFEKGKELVKRFGVFETFRAEKVLTEDHMRKVIESIPEQATAEDFRKQVDHFEAKQKKIEEKQPEDYKLKCIRLESQLKKAEAENKRLKEENERLKRILNGVRDMQQKVLAQV